VGFRFRKSVKLLPGIRLNVGLGGASLSLGGRGATLNLSSRGARATVGVPGTGLSYSTKLTGPASSTRRRTTRSTQQLTAEYRRLAAERQYELAQAQVEQMEGELEALLNSWRDTPGLATENDLRAGLTAQSFTEDPPLYEPLDLEAERRGFEHRLRSEVLAVHPRPRYLGYAVIVLGCVLAILIGMMLASSVGPRFRVAAALSLGLLAGLVCHGTLIGRWSRSFNERLSRGLGAWGIHREALERQHAEVTAAAREAHGKAAREWAGRERERISLLTRVLAGDVATIHDVITFSLEAMDFPFETACDIAVATGDASYLRVDLPEIEDVVPEIRLKALKRGTVKEVKRKKSERHDAYAHLAAGLALQLAGNVLSVAPSVQVVHITAYTQRKQRGGHTDDDYVYEVSVTRKFYATMTSDSVDPLNALTQLGARFEMKKDGEFKKIRPPAWVADFFAPDAEVRASSA
jgi:hypothetical protein